MNSLTEWLERAAVAMDLKRVNGWLRLLLVLMFLGLVAVILYGDWRATHP